MPKGAPARTRPRGHGCFIVPDLRGARGHATKIRGPCSMERVSSLSSFMIPSMSPSTDVAPGSVAWSVLRAAGSLKITVVTFLIATFLLFVGTLAQDEKNLPEVKAEYFNAWVAIVPLADFFPVTVFGTPFLTGWFPFPGGATIGLVLLVNLVAAKATRFSVMARGPRLVEGALVTVLGAALTAAVILAGHDADGLQGSPPFAYSVVWRLVQLGGVIAAICLGLAARRSRQRLVQWLLGGAAAVMAAVVMLTLLGGDAWRMNDPGLRIMWQLMQSSGAAVVLLAGLMLVFGSRGGNVLIHVAVGLLMLGQIVFGDRQIEQRMSILEGESAAFAFRTDETELAIIRSRDEASDSVTAISGRLLAARSGGPPVSIETLPFDVHVLDYFPNSALAAVGLTEQARATAGLGLQWQATRSPPQGGVSSRSNVASAYVRLIERGTGRDLGTFLVSQYLNDQAQLFMGGQPDSWDSVEVAGAAWRIQLRFRRDYKSYTVTLDDVRRLDYSASDTPRDYSSYVTFTDSFTRAEQKGRIWMNNPVRYRGETFYQSQYSQVDRGDGKRGEMTGLQVVENAGWLIPYVACVLAFWGMLVHFGTTFVRFADRRERESRSLERPAGQSRQPATDALPWPIPTVAISLVATVVLLNARQQAPRGSESNWREAGTIPVMHEGRVKPLDSAARHVLQFLGQRSYVVMPQAAPLGSPRGRISATEWLLAHMAGSEWADKAPVFRIDALEVLDLFDLTRRQGHRYTAAELAKGRAQLHEQTEVIRRMAPQDRTFVQNKYLEIDQKLMAFDLVRVAYEVPAIPDLTGAGDESRRAALEQFAWLLERARMVELRHPVAVVPPLDDAMETTGSASPARAWQALYPAAVESTMARLLDGHPGMASHRMNPAVEPFVDLLKAVESRPERFNRALETFRQATAGLPAVRDSAKKAAYEAWFNAFNPVDLAKWLYVAATVVCFLSFLVCRESLNRFVTWMLLATLLLHTFALASRMYLTGRPPVVNLYSSAVFIGWASVIAGLALEVLFRLGIGNLVASLSGGLSLMVAYGLHSGDTMHVLQAVLDTQFWLSTHVVTVTLGYGATFLAGMLGTCVIVERLWSRWSGGDTAASRRLQDRFYRMTYGVVCFALFFSFIGTVLGGLWADDSWGRFWGWDPKENGALMIVLWNAAALHARWDRWIGPRGFALFAIGGNIITAWSWFGTNQLGIGLHSYGFTSGVLMLLGGYVASQLALIGVGLVLTRPSTTSFG